MNTDPLDDFLASNDCDEFPVWQCANCGKVTQDVPSWCANCAERAFELLTQAHVARGLAEAAHEQHEAMKDEAADMKREQLAERRWSQR